MLKQLIAVKSAARRCSDRLTNAYYEVTRQNKLVINGLVMPHDLPLRKLKVWYDEFDSELLSRKRASEARYLARLVQPEEPCWVIFEPRYFSDATALLLQLRHQGAHAKVFAAPGEPDRRIESARRVPCMSFLREIMPLHSYELITEIGTYDACKAIASGAALCQSAFIFADIPIAYVELTGAKKLENLMLCHQFNHSGKKNVRTFLNNVERDGYFIDGRFSSESRLLARKRSTRNRY